MPLKSAFTAGTRITLIPLLLAMGACSTAPVAPKPDPRLDQLSVGMEQCIRSQQQANDRLLQQQSQLERQQQTLDALSLAVTADEGGAPPPEVVTTTVLASEACAATAIEGAELERSAKLLIGELEEVWLENLQLALPARIDTGAETASLDARNIEVFERDGRRWVRFEILHPVSGEALVMERRLKRMVSIIQANSPEAERRPVIKLDITIGHISQTAEFTLSDRSHLDYQVLVGRNILQDVMVVDVSRKNIAPYQLEGDAGSNP